MGDSHVGTEYEKSELGLDQEGHGKYRGVAFESGLAFLIIPLAAGTVEEVRFVRLSTGTIPPQVDPRDLAQCEHDRGLYEESIVHCNQWILIDPTDWRGYHLLGMNHQALGRYQEAIEAFQRAASIEPQSPSPRSSLDSVFVRMTRHQEAVAALEEAVRIEPGLQQAHSDLGRAYWALNRREEAIEAYKRASLIKPDDAAALYSLGRACSQVGRSDEAIEAYEKVQRILPWFEPSLPRDLGILYFQAGRYEEALMMLEEAIGIKRDDIDARYYLGLTHARMGNKTLALGQYETLRKLNEDRAGELLSEIAR